MHTYISKMSALKITTTEMHTAGEPLRILESGVPKIHGDTILDKRRYVRENLDYIRKLVIHEPQSSKSGSIGQNTWTQLHKTFNKWLTHQELKFNI